MGALRVLVAGLFVVGAGCQNKPAEGGKGAEAAGPSQEDIARDQLGAKMNVFVTCMNDLEPEIRDSRKTYFEWVDPKKGPSGKGTVYGVREIVRESTYGRDCLNGLDKVGGMPPKVKELDDAGAAYKAAVAKIIQVNNEAYTYYEHKDYKDDDFAKGKSMHEPLMAAWDEFEKAAAGLRAAVDHQQDDLAAKDLAELEKSDGKKLAYHQKNVMIRAKALLRTVADAETPDEAAIAASIDLYTKAYDEMKDWSAKNPADAKKNVHWENFQRYSEEIIIECKEMMRSFRDKKGLPKEGSGSIEALIGKYNQLVNLSNMMFD